MLTVFPISAFSDNYIWLIRSNETPEAFVVDPGDATPVIDYLKRHQLKLAGILITHHHPDHVGGVSELIAHSEIQADSEMPVLGPYNPAIGKLITHPLREGDQATVFGVTFDVLEVPGHTLDHIVFYTDRTPEPLLFCGDTLFAGGCGRVFEGTFEQMYASLQKLAALPANTQIFCAHEYTMGNLHFAKAVEPSSEALQSYIDQCKTLREEDKPTLPSSIGNELAINPFLRSHIDTVKQSAEAYSGQNLSTAAAVFKATRTWKDNF